MADANIKYKVSQTGAEKVSNSFKKIAQTVGIAFAVRQVVNFAIALKNAARDGVEIRQKFAVVFSSLERGAESVADAFAKEFRLAGASSRELLGNVGDLLVGFGFTEQAALDMSVQVNSLAQDLASFSNFSGGAIGASNALTKALVGETESVKALGIVIRQTTPEFIRNVQDIMNVQEVTLLQAKAIEILRIAYEQSTKALGDFSRTQESLANQERILDEQIKELSESLGNDLTPVFRNLTSQALESVEAFAELNILFQQFTGASGKTGKTFALGGQIGLITGLFDAIGNAMGRLPQLEREIRLEIEASNRARMEGLELAKKLNAEVFISQRQKKPGTGFFTISEVDIIRDGIREITKEINGQGLSMERLQELLFVRKGLEDRLKLPIEEVNNLLKERVAIIKETIAASGEALVAFGAGSRTPGVGEGIEGRQGRPGASTLFGNRAQVGKIVSQGKKIGDDIFDGWANVLTSNMNTAWAEIFGEANSLFEQLINSMTDLLVKSVFSQLIGLLPGGGILSFVGSLFGGGGGGAGQALSPIGGGGGQPLIVQVNLGGRIIGQAVLEGNKQIRQLRLTE